MSANPVHDLGVEPLDEHNKKLLDHVHPRPWENPVPSGRYNMVVVGAGTAGLVTANGAAGLGAKVALIERHLMGGDCLNVGCVPSKALIRAAHAIADVRDAGDYGVRVPAGSNVDFPFVMERMRRLRARISHADSAQRYKGLGIDVFIGDAKFTGPDTVEVGGQTLRFARACIATGARAFVPPIPGLREAGYLTNESVFNLTELPKRLAVIGAGPIGCELAQAFARFGSQVHLLEPSDHVMSREDRDAAEIVQNRMIRDGVKLYTQMRVLKVEMRGGDKVVSVDQGGRTTEIACDAILVAAGRAPNVEGMGLEAAGVAWDTKLGVHVDDCLQTIGNKRIYAAGDATSKYKFTHAADFLARTVIENALFKTGLLSIAGRKKATTLTIPWCTYTDPEVAHVGAYERELREKGVPHRTFTQELKEVDRAILDGEDEGFVRVHVEAKTDKILGATIVAKQAGDMINELTLAMVNGIGLGSIAKVIHPYPTRGEAIRKAGDLFNRTRLTPKAKAFTTWLMARRR